MKVSGVNVHDHACPNGIDCCCPANKEGDEEVTAKGRSEALLGDVAAVAFG
jgi:hypothetical protein